MFALRSLTLVFSMWTMGMSRSLTPTPASLPLERSCQIAQFKSLSPREMQAFKMAKDTYEKSMLQKERKCSSRFFHRAWDFRQLQPADRPVVLEAELKLTLEVLKGIKNPEMEDVLTQPLQTLSHIYREIQSCVTPLPSRGHKLPGDPNNWLHRLIEAGKKESQSCLETSVMLTLFRLLTQDLRCVAYGDLC